MDHLESWLYPAIGEDYDGDYLIFDCPGQIELYTHMDLMQRFVKQLQDWSFRVCGVYTIDAHFLTDGSKFIAGSLTALSTMINMEIPHMNILTKMDLLSKRDRKNVERFLEPDAMDLINSEIETPWNMKYLNLSLALGRILDDYSLVKYFPLDIRKDSNMENLLLMSDLIMGVSDEADVKVKDFDTEFDDDD
jgi:GTPase SAR1 family protein